MKRIFSMEIRIFVISLLTSISCSVFATDELNSTDAESFALGNLQALSKKGNNPAWLSYQKKGQLGLSVYNQFEMKELSTYNLYGFYPNKYLDGGINFFYYGYEDYQIIQTQLGFAKKIFPNFSLGINLTYYNQTSILEEITNNYLSSDIGVYYQCNESLALAFLANKALHTGRVQLWNVYGGVNYGITDNCSALLEINYGYSGLFNLSLGFEYELLDQIILRTGLQTRIKAPSFGVGYKWNHWIIDAGFSMHPILGLSSIIGLNYQF